MLPKEKIWVAGGDGTAHKIATSSDGVSWTGSTSGDAAFAGTGGCRAVAYNGASGLWVAGATIGSAHNIAYSSNGVEWTGSTSGDAAFTGGSCRAVAYNGIAGASGLWVAGGGVDSPHKIATSSDGVEWTGRASGDAAFTGGACRAVAYNGIAGSSGLWVAGANIGSAHKIATSSNGVEWTGSTSGDLAFTGGSCQAVAYNGIDGAYGLWVAGGNGAHYIATSSNGVEWTGSTSGDAAFTGGRCNAVAHNGIAGGSGLWVAGGNGAHKIATSRNGVEWTGSTSGDLVFGVGTCYAVAYGNGLWVAGNDGSYSIAYSSDGNSWTGSMSGEAALYGGACQAVAFGEAYVPTPPPPPGPEVDYIPSVASSFNIFGTNFRGMGNLGEYY